jgi:type IV secretory pathway VirB2 component (pilin)
MRKFARSTRTPAVAALASVAASPAQAAGGGMPWDGPLSQVVTSLTGPVAGSLIAVAIVASGLTMAFAAGQGMRQFAGIIFAGSIVGIGLVFFLGLFGLTAGAVF